MATTGLAALDKNARMAHNLAEIGWRLPCILLLDQEKEETVLYLLGTYPARCKRRRRHLDAYYIDVLGRFIASSNWLEN